MTAQPSPAQPVGPDGSLEHHVYWITGASKGFGLAIAEALLRAGARVGIAARGDADLAAAAAGLREQYGEDRVLATVCDVGQKAQVVESLQKVAAHFGQLNGVVNNAGLARPASVEHLLEDEVLAQLNTNFLGTVFCCQAAIPLLRGADNPRIVNMSSASAWHYDEMMHLSIYASTKAAVERFTRDLRLECQADRIGVTCIRPGGAWTHFAEGWDSDRLAAGMQLWAERFGPMADSGMQVSHVADAVCFALRCPPGVAVDLLEVRPNELGGKAVWDG